VIEAAERRNCVAFPRARYAKTMLAGRVKALVVLVVLVVLVGIERAERGVHVVGGASRRKIVVIPHGYPPYSQ
jgi:hypothetical protein